MRVPFLPLLSIISSLNFGAPVTAQTDCIDNLSMLVVAELFITDTSNRREYILCPDTTFVTSNRLSAGETTEADAPITIRPNMSVKCGASGERSNNCIITGGVGMTGTPENFMDRLDLGNVLIQGITFSGLEGVNFNLEKFNGKVSIEDCAFVESTAFPNILINGGTPVGDNTPTDQHLVTTFKDCLFANNTIISAASVEDVAALVWLPSGLQTTNFIGCSFLTNDFDERVAKTEVEAIIGVTNGTLSMERNCFIDNDVDFVGVVQTFPRQPKLSLNNFGTQPDRYICDFVGTYYLRPDGIPGGPICVYYDSTICLAKDAAPAGVTQPPTMPPVAPTTPRPTFPATPSPIVLTLPPVPPPTPFPVSPPTADLVSPTAAPVEPTAAPVPPPTVAPVEPTAAPVPPTVAPVDPTAAPVPPTAAPVEPTAAPVPPTAAPVDPTAAPVPPTAAPVEPTAAPVPPTVAPVDPTAAPVPPTAAPVEPTAAPVPPTAAPVDPTAAPVPPTAAPTEPTAAPVPPTAAPAEPTAAPVPPTAAPAEPTAAPVPPTAAPVEPTAAPDLCTPFNLACSTDADCCSNNCFRSVTSPSVGSCRGNGVGSVSKSTAKLGGNRGGAGGQGAMRR